MTNYIKDVDYRFQSGRFKRRDGKWFSLSTPEYYLWRYTKGLSHYSIWTRLETYAQLND